MVFRKAVIIHCSMKCLLSAQPHAECFTTVVSFCPCEVVTTPIPRFHSRGNWGLNKESQTHSAGFKHHSDCRIENTNPYSTGLYGLKVGRGVCVCVTEGEGEGEGEEENEWENEKIEYIEHRRCDPAA